MLSADPIFPHSAPQYYSQIEENCLWPTGQVIAKTAKALARMKDLGYEKSKSIADLDDVAVTEPAKIIDQAGADMLREAVTSLLRQDLASGETPVSHVIRAAAYRSRLVRDFCLDPELANFVSRCIGKSTVATALVHQLGIINYTTLPASQEAPIDIGGWHIDQNAYVIVMSLGGMDGAQQGFLEYFEGTREEGLHHILSGRKIPQDRIRQIALPGPGWGVVMHGSLLFHRAGPAVGPLQRFSVVTAFEPRNVEIPDQNLSCIVGLDENPSAAVEHERRAFGAEYARHKAWRAQGHLDDFLKKDLWNLSAEEVSGMLLQCGEELVRFAEMVRRGEVSEIEAIGEYLNRTD